MNLEFSDDQKFIQKSAREYLDANCGLEVCRGVLESDASYSDNLWKGLAEMGWLGAAVPESYGGSGMGQLELVLIAQEMGRALAPVPFASSVYLATEAILLYGSEDQKKRWLPRLAKGDAIGTFALHEGVGDLELGETTLRFDGGAVTGVKLPVLDGDVASLAIVLARDGAAHSLCLVDLAGAGVTRTKLASFDPSRSQAKIAFAGAKAELLGQSGQGVAQTERVLDRAAVLMGFEQIGSSERALDITRDYTMSRYAFGRAVASFQSIKHRMADWYGRNQIALSNGYWAAWALSTGSPELGLAACNVRVAASEAFLIGSQEMVQMHGGVGFTWEFDCHLFYRRAQLLSLALGSPSAWREKLVRRIEHTNPAA